MASWFVLCNKDAAPALAAVANKLDKLPDGAKVSMADEGIAIDYEGCRVEVEFETGRSVEAEAREIAADHAADRPDRDDIAQLDARFVLLYQASQAGEVFNVLAGAAETLEKLSKGVVFDADNSRFA